MILLSLFQVLFIFLGTRRLARILRLNFLTWGHPVLSYSFESSLGLAVLSFIIFTAAVFQKISAGFLWGLFAVLLPLVLLELKELIRCRFQFKNQDWIWTACLFLYLGLILAGAALPVSDRDEMIYQLEIPRQMLQARGFLLFPDNFYAYFPQMGSLLALWGLGTLGELSARLFHALYGALAAASLYGFGRQILSKGSAALAVLLFLTVPSVMKLMTLAYVDLTYSCYAFLALAALLNDAEKRHWKRFLAAGILCGCAAAVKYPGLQLMGLLGVFVLLEYLKKRDKELIKCIPLLGVGVLVILPYLIRNWAATGWPLFPFSILDLPLQPVLNWDKERAELFLGWLGQFGLDPYGNPVLQTLFAPFEVFVRGRFNEPRFYEGVLGPVFLLTPLLLRGSKEKTISSFGIFSVLFLYYWALTTKQVRFLIPVLPVLSLMLAYGLKNASMIWKIIAGALIAGNAAMGLLEIGAVDPLPYLQGRESREKYLERQLPVYPIYQEVNRSLKPGEKVYLIHMKNYGYYLNVPWTADFIFERYRLEQLLRTAPSSSELANFFKSIQVNYLMLDEAHLLSPDWGMDPEALQLFMRFLTKQAQLVSRDKNFCLYRLIR